MSSRGRWLALTAALLGWMFDGLEMGLFPLVGRPALRELLDAGTDEKVVGSWFSVINAGFLIGAATGGVLFGWLGDRIGRVRAMTLSVLVYAGCSGVCGFAAAPWQLAVLRFAGALGMGGEWALGVALVMELWPSASRAWLAGLIGAFGNLGYFLLACVALGLNRVGGDLGRWLESLGVGADAIAYLTRNGNWRLLMLVGAVPSVLTLFIRLFVPESEKWTAERQSGKVSHWSSRDLLMVLVGATLGALVLTVWVTENSWTVKLLVTAIGLFGMAACYLYPARQYLQRSAMMPADRKRILGRMLLAAGLSGVPLLATWGGVMWVYNLVDVHVKAGHFDLGPGFIAEDARPLTQVSSAFGAAVGCVIAAVVGGAVGRKWVYAVLCVLSGATLYSFYAFYPAFFDWGFVAAAGGVGLITAAFYGWLPLYLPELFPTAVRATGQGFGFNFGRVLASIGSLQTGALLAAFDNDYAKACSVAAGVYVLGLVLIAFAPETKGKELPA
jgi:SHS family sialic acid transporter-like MFS transporter